MARILVTGGAGFLGSHLCTRLLDDGHHVTALDNFYTGHPENVAHILSGPHASRFELVRHDVVEPFYGEVEQIYHLACPASPVHYQRNPVRTLKTAVFGTTHALELAAQTHARILVASTSEIYGEPEVHPQPEHYRGNVSTTGKRSCYDEGKRCGEALTAAYAEQHRVDARIVRIFNTYGPRMHEEDGRVVSNFISQALRRQPLTIYGDGSQTRSLCYATDLIEGMVALMATASDPGPVNLGNPEEMTVAEIADLVLSITGSPSAIEWRPLPADDPTRRRPDISKARELLAWEPRIEAADGIALTVDYYRGRLPLRRTNGHTQRSSSRASVA